MDEMERLKKEQEEAQEKAGLYSAFANVADSVANVPSTWAIMRGKTPAKIDAGSGLRTLAEMEKDPWTRREKMLSMAKAMREEKLASAESNPDSEESKTARQAYAGFGLNVPQNATAASLAKAYGKVHDYALTKFKGDQERQNMLAKNTAERMQGKQLPPDKVLALNEAAQVPKLLDDLGKTVEANKDAYGPIQGRIASLNPWNEQVKTVDAQTRTVRQTIGKLKEGGVLRKEDEEKYAKMLPEITDTPEVAKNKIALVRREMMRQFGDSVSALGTAGYDTRAFANLTEVPPELPKVISGVRQEGVAHAGDTGPHGPTVSQGGHTYVWNPQTKRYE